MPKKINFDKLKKESEQNVEAEFRFNPAKARQMVQAKGVPKERVTIWLDADVLDHFRALAAKPDAAGYQTQINTALRAVIAGLSGSSEDDLAERIARKVAAKLRRAA